LRVVVIGGTGNFGARICRRLVQEPHLEVIATGRRLTDPSGFTAVQLDIDSPSMTQRLMSLAPDLVIHCAGPFQGQDYRVAVAALACRAHYIDLADGREFVLGFADAVDALARQTGKAAITGASTLPALSSAVIDALRPAFSSIQEIHTIIAPGQHAPRGVATVSAVLSYAGQPFRWLKRGRWTTTYGWQDLTREHLRVGQRTAAACDVPDLALLPTRYPGVQTVTFRAALEVSLQHYVLWAFAAWRRLGLPFRVDSIAPMVNRAGDLLNALGSDRGGMTVTVIGRDLAQQPKQMRWELMADANHGPEIPCMPAVLLACRLNRGEDLAPGATVCMGMLSLAEFAPELARWQITTV
jgi:saccharopine dehydrogenase-like NADP-dependent oxidoreductase